MEAAAIEKSILIRVLKTSHSNDVKTVDDTGTDGYDIEKLFPSSSRRSDPDPNPGSPRYENAWFIMEPAESGLKISQIFAGLPQDQSLLSVQKPASTLVGSYLYEIGGYRDLNSNHKRAIREPYGEIRCLDIQNQSAGWKSCSQLDFEFQGDRAASYNQYIYMFSRILTPGRVPANHFAYVYDTIKQNGYLIQAPPGFLKIPIAEFWTPLEGHGMLVSFPRADNGKFYLHDPDLNCWKPCDNYEPLPPITRGPSSVLNGILYICDNRNYVLHAYDCSKGKLLYSIELPRLCTKTRSCGEDMSYHPEQLVAVSDSRLCIIGHSLRCLFCAHVSVSYNPQKAPSTNLLGVQCFRKDKIDSVLNCVRVDASLGRIAKNFRPVDASLDRIVKDSMPMDETREEHMPSKGNSTMEMSGSSRKVMRSLEDASLFGQKTTRMKGSKKTIHPISTLPRFPFSKRTFYQPPMKKVTQRLSRLKLSPTPINLPSGPTHQLSDDAVRIIHIPVRMKLGRHQDMKGLGNDSSEGQG